MKTWYWPGFESVMPSSSFWGSWRLGGTDQPVCSTTFFVADSRTYTSTCSMAPLSVSPTRIVSPWLQPGPASAVAKRANDSRAASAARGEEEEAISACSKERVSSRASISLARRTSR